jgi:hypothetical protein
MYVKNTVECGTHCISWMRPMKELNADSLYVELAFVKHGNFSPNVTSDDLTCHCMYVVIMLGDLASLCLLVLTSRQKRYFAQTMSNSTSCIKVL